MFSKYYQSIGVCKKTIEFYLKSKALMDTFLSNEGRIRKYPSATQCHLFTFGRPQSQAPKTPPWGPNIIYLPIETTKGPTFT